MPERKRGDTIYDSTLRLDILAADIIEGAKDFYEQKVTGGRSIRERVEDWFENYFTPAFECAIEDAFEGGDQNA